MHKRVVLREPLLFQTAGSSIEISSKAVLHSDDKPGSLLPDHGPFAATICGSEDHAAAKVLGPALIFCGFSLYASAADSGLGDEPLFRGRRLGLSI